MLRIAVLASGSGTNLQSIIDACESGQIDGTVALVISNNKDAFALERGRKHGTEALFIDHRGKTREEHEREVSEEIDRRDIGLIVLAGYLRMFTSFFVNKYKNKIINTHPALLPKYGGKGMHGHTVHEAVLEKGDEESGCTVHFVTEEIDGGPIIGQMRVKVLPGDTPETLQARVLEKEHILLPIVVQWFAEGRVVLVDGEHRVIVDEKD
jgi:phosphoribosylglycinamide formyltransferase-1